MVIWKGEWSWSLLRTVLSGSKHNHRNLNAVSVLPCTAELWNFFFARTLRCQLSLHRIPGSLNDVRLAPGRVHLLSVFWAPGPRQGRCPRGQKASRSSWARECHGFNLSHYQRQMTLDRVESVREHGRALRGPSPSPQSRMPPPHPCAACGVPCPPCGGCGVLGFI